MPRGSTHRRPLRGPRRDDATRLPHPTGVSLAPFNAVARRAARRRRRQDQLRAGERAEGFPGVSLALAGGCPAAWQGAPTTALSAGCLQAEPEAFVSEVDAAAADAVVLVGLLGRLARPTAFLEVLLCSSITS